MKPVERILQEVNRTRNRRRVNRQQKKFITNVKKLRQRIRSGKETEFLDAVKGQIKEKAWNVQPR